MFHLLPIRRLQWNTSFRVPVLPHPACPKFKTTSQNDNTNHPHLSTTPIPAIYMDASINRPSSTHLTSSHIITKRDSTTSKRSALAYIPPIHHPFIHPSSIHPFIHPSILPSRLPTSETLMSELITIEYPPQLSTATHASSLTPPRNQWIRVSIHRTFQEAPEPTNKTGLNSLLPREFYLVARCGWYAWWWLEGSPIIYFLLWPVYLDLILTNL